LIDKKDKLFFKKQKDLVRRECKIWKLIENSPNESFLR